MKVLIVSVVYGPAQSPIRYVCTSDALTKTLRVAQKDLALKLNYEPASMSLKVDQAWLEVVKPGHRPGFQALATWEEVDLIEPSS